MNRTQIDIITADGKRFELHCPEDATAADLTEVSARISKVAEDAKKSVRLFT